MKSKNIFIIIFIIVLVAFVIGAIALGSNNVSVENTTTSLQNNQPERQSIDRVDSVEVSLEEVQKNNTLDSCMVIYNNNVYKIPSSFANQHQGGAREIINACGKDITSGFNSVGAHNSTAENMLAGFFFAKLARWNE